MFHLIVFFFMVAMLTAGIFFTLYKKEKKNVDLAVGIISIIIAFLLLFPKVQNEIYAAPEYNVFQTTADYIKTGAEIRYEMVENNVKERFKTYRNILGSTEYVAYLHQANYELQLMFQSMFDQAEDPLGINNKDN